MARFLRIDGTEMPVAPLNKRDGFTLDELYALLSCTTIECVPLGEGYQLVIDEDGKAKPDLPPNPMATRLLRQAGGMPTDYVVGAALVVSARELQ